MVSEDQPEAREGQAGRLGVAQRFVPSPATSRSERAASTMAPPGICPISATPISTWVYFCVVRYTATNGPNPVCTSARKKMNQSRSRKLWREGVGAALRAIDFYHRTGPSPRPVARPRWSSIGSADCLGERANRLLLRNHQGLNCNGCRLPDAPSTTIGVSSL